MQYTIKQTMCTTLFIVLIVKILRCKTCATNKEKMAEVKKKRKEDTCDNTPDANDPWYGNIL